ncbi:imidazole glycerol phosphate synthase subunit HisH [Phnomibacter ginsenosidimutans]|uniref:Imidazole glycerol phosphate synthase subunit HisH n=1 Tax=Phnomibacter ginsenosidimutans TaxID=2676868 RepID=A0A6I6GKL4_9BACT|nr:imidazole glycerol phosphate synthase subunit HisH [Phnomibacter ginsenosidimutans]QGW28985.1 imidazole glycerol phosphate synthase subunit HisH [Phnomibacter ginsenosidimutans]
MKTVAIIKYNAGNIRSVLFALERLGVAATVTDDHELIRQSSHVIFPGVGAANSAMPYLQERGLDQLMLSLTQPFLGICLGMQLMCRHSEEGDTKCLGMFDIAVRKFPATDDDGQRIKTPHMGWNSLYNLQSPIMKGVDENAFMYFVHSYYAEISSHTIAACNYALPFSAALQKDNFFGVQFHTEKSAAAGEQILKNFLAL